MAELKEGTKNDSGKPRFDLIPPDFMWLMADLLAMGAKKYADRNWEQGIQFGRVFAALQRHAWKFWAGEEFDPEDGQRHLISVAWCAMVLLHYSLNNLKYKEFDDRVKGDFQPWKTVGEAIREMEETPKVDIPDFTEALAKMAKARERSFIYHCSYPGCNNPVVRHHVDDKIYCFLHKNNWGEGKAG